MEMLHDLKVSIDWLKVQLIGNGHDGMLTRMRLLEERLDQLAQSHERHKLRTQVSDGIRWKAIGHLAVAAAAAISLILQLL